MFKTVTMTGRSGSISWAYHAAAVLSGWTVHRTEQHEWTLTANIDRADRFKLAQRPLFFNAPRRGGFYTWPINSVTVGHETLKASLGPPEA
jgi:hypothetical protein